MEVQLPMLLERVKLSVGQSCNVKAYPIEGGFMVQVIIPLCYVNSRLGVEA